MLPSARFDPRLATAGTSPPPRREPFDPLSVALARHVPRGRRARRSADILVDDEGHADDLAARAIAVAERVRSMRPENLRAWLAKEFFPLHIKMYSKSRRKAPIYWQLATPSASYSVWLYIHAFSKDTLFRVQNDYVAPKLAHEERRLESLTSELRDGTTAAQRKTLAAQEAVVDELRAFLDEVKRVAPLWKPNLDDGVIINFAPLWRLVPQNKAWQKELKSTCVGRSLRGQVRLGSSRNALLARARGAEVREGPQPGHRPRARGRVLGRGHGRQVDRPQDAHAQRGRARA
ncbi:MAG: hypothetical protein U1E65_32245 [Myxococcota bacterium]